MRSKPIRFAYPFDPLAVRRRPAARVSRWWAAQRFISLLDCARRRRRRIEIRHGRAITLLVPLIRNQPPQPRSPPRRTKHLPLAKQLGIRRHQQPR